MTRYGRAHRNVRAAWLAEAYGTLCHLCGKPMLWPQPLDLDHTADGTGYRGMAHSSCNRREGGRRGNARQRRRKLQTPWEW